MPVSLSRQTAQKIVETVKEVCGCDVNYINTKGMIFASTDEKRIGNYHEIGKKAAETGETIEVGADDAFYGTQKGVNLPFRYQREIVAVIGISGEPEEVRKYATLAKRITMLIIREHEMDSLNYNRRSIQNYVIRALTGESELSYEYLSDYFQEMGLDLKADYRTIRIRLHDRYHMANTSMMEQEVYRVFDLMQAKLYTFNFPDEYILLLPEEQYQSWSYIFKTLAQKQAEILFVGIGGCHTIWKLKSSYEEAGIALASLEGTNNYASFDLLDLDLLLGCVTEGVKEAYLKKTVQTLREEDLRLLRIYFEQEMSLKDTAEELFLHKNTVQYQLNRIERMTGLNPRQFKSAVKLYLAIRLKEPV